MKYYRKAQETAQKIVEAFKPPEILPEAMSSIFLKADNIPSAKWSFTNQFLQFIQGTNDARGYKQWQEVGRHVKPKTQGIKIFAPCTRKTEDKETGESKTFVSGFRAITVHPVENTDGEPLNSQNTAFLDSLPFKEVADKWGIGGRNGIGKLSYAKSSVVTYRNSPESSE